MHRKLLWLSEFETFTAIQAKNAGFFSADSTGRSLAKSREVLFLAGHELIVRERER